jgi:acyl-CoA synthetase (AMP-forming)/AMP-acid ligase II
VEAILTQHPDVRDAAVIGLKDDDLGRRVHALIEPANADAPPALEELDAHLRLHLASYKLAARLRRSWRCCRAMRLGRSGGASCGISVEDSGILSK